MRRCLWQQMCLSIAELFGFEMPELRNQLEICLYALTLLSLLRTAHVKEPPLLRDWTRVDDDELDEIHEVGFSPSTCKYILAVMHFLFSWLVCELFSAQTYVRFSQQHWRTTMMCLSSWRDVFWIVTQANFDLWAHPLLFYVTLGIDFRDDMIRCQMLSYNEQLPWSAAWLTIVLLSR